MYVARAKWKSKNNQVYQSVWLRESYREKGKVKTRNIANLKDCSPQQIAALELALKHKDDLGALVSLSQIELCQGKSFGAIYVLSQLAKTLGLEKALGIDRQGQLALWQVMARVLDQGSRLSAVRLAGGHAVAEVLGLEQGFDEDDLYHNLTWLSERQEQIEDGLFQARHPEEPPALFLYDVTSSYLEGRHNDLAAYGYNRDQKSGRPQIVIGLLCDNGGDPVSTEVFEGNTSDVQTVASQVKKLSERFGGGAITLVGDRGMLKGPQIEDLTGQGFHYITAITKPQIRSLLNQGVLQMGLFDQSLREVEVDGVRYILRRNPIRAAEMAASRQERLAVVAALVERQNKYLSAHPRARVLPSWEKVTEKIEQLRVGSFARAKVEGRGLRLVVDEAALKAASELDGCYVLKTDLPREVADKETVHARYKDLALVERAFRTFKTDYLEVRPVYVRTAAHTRGHVLVVMLAYLLVRALERRWSDLDLRVEEGLDRLKGLGVIEIVVKGAASLWRIPGPEGETRRLLEALGLKLPEVVAPKNLAVGTRKKLSKRRK